MGMSVVKKELSESEIAPLNIRYSGTPPVFQVTDDGGATWVDSPQADPRYNPANLLPPLSSYSGIECDVAARMTAQLRDTLTIFLNSVDAAQFASGVLGLLAFEFGWIGWLLDLFLLVGNVLIDVGQSNIEAAFTSGVYDDIQCIFSCYVQTNGQISQNALDAAYDAIKAAHSGTVATVIDELRLLYGDVAMSNAGVARDDTGDCSGCDSCEWIVEYDFTGGNTHGFLTDINPPLIFGSFNGAKFVDTAANGYRQLVLFKQLPGKFVTGMSILTNQFHGTGIGNHAEVGDLTNTSNPPTWTTKSSGGMATNTPISWLVVYNAAGFTLTEGILLYQYCDSNGSGYQEISKIRLRGTGEAPTDGARVSSLT